MKNLIVTISLIILATVMLIAQEDINIMQRQGFLAKDTADQMAAAAGTALQDERYAEGFIFYDYELGTERAEYTLRQNLQYSMDYMPGNGYYSDQAIVYVYFFDESNIGQYYRNGVWQGQFNFMFGDRGSRYIKDLKEDFVIERACVYCSFDAGKPRLRLKEGLGKGHIRKESVYEYLD